jgi:hypothetical protein
MIISIRPRSDQVRMGDRGGKQPLSRAECPARAANRRQRKRGANSEVGKEWRDRGAGVDIKTVSFGLFEHRGDFCEQKR